MTISTMMVTGVEPVGPKIRSVMRKSTEPMPAASRTIAVVICRPAVLTNRAFVVRLPTQPAVGGLAEQKDYRQRRGQERHKVDALLFSVQSRTSAPLLRG